MILCVRQNGEFSAKIVMRSLSSQARANSRTLRVPVSCYSSIIALTDGEDYGSKRSASECAEVVSDYRRNDRNQIQTIGVKVAGSPNY